MNPEIRKEMIECIKIRGCRNFGFIEEEIDGLNDQDLRDLALIMSINI